MRRWFLRGWGGENTPRPLRRKSDRIPEARGNPADASGAFRSGPRAPTEAVKPFFKTLNCYKTLNLPQIYIVFSALGLKIINIIEALAKLLTVGRNRHSGQTKRDPESGIFKQFWIPGFDGITD